MAMDNEQLEQRIALFIDCDNASVKAIYGIMEELAKYGETGIRRAYGNWTEKNPWEEVLHDYAIQPFQQFPYTKGKNATDMAMAIDVMDTLYSEDIDIFAIVSSDSDFTPLAMKLRAKSKMVIGFGEEKTPSPFIHSCNLFVFTDKLDEMGGMDDIPEMIEPKDEKKDKKKLRSDTKLMNAIRQAIAESKDDDDWALAAKVSQQISRRTSMSPKNFGYSTWPKLIHATESFEERKNAKGHQEFKLKTKASK